MNCFFLFFFIAAVCSVCSRSQEEEAKADDTINVSSNCAAVLLASGTTLGAGVAYALTPAALCTAGFCAPGVAAGSFASWWQSTMPLVVKGSLFAKLQAIAAGGVTGMGSSVAGAAVGGAVAASYLRDFCAFVDETDPESAMGRAFSASVSVVLTAIATKEELVAQCSSSVTCTAVTETVSEAGATAVESVSSMWDSFVTSASKAASRAYGNWETDRFAQV